MQAPYEQLIVVSSRSELLFIEAPLESADLLLVASQLRLKVVPAPQISMQYGLISRPSTQELAIPCDAPNAAIMPRERAN